MTNTHGSSHEIVRYNGLRDWLDKVDGFGELLKVSGASWDREMGSITQLLTEKANNTAPAILFDDIPGYPKGYRTLYGHFSTTKRIAMTLGLPINLPRKVDYVKAYHQRLRDLKPIPPRYVEAGPILENVITGDDVDVLKFPAPIHHEQDKARYIGTASCCMTQDPDEGWYNIGAYRCQVYDGNKIGCQITEGKHGRIHRDKNFERGQSMKFVIIVGQDPLLFMVSGSPLPDGLPELDVAGGLRGEPIDVIRGPYTGFPIPADCEIALECDAIPGNVLPEGPFGEWMGYYSDDSRPRPYLNVRTILHRNNPIICCAPQHKPIDETGLLRALGNCSEIWRALDLSGVPDVLGVWNHEAGPATRFTVVQIRQRYPGHARQALHIAASCAGGAYNGKWTVVVDDDIDAGELGQVLWAMCTRFNPETDIDLIKRAWSSGRDPMFQPGNFNSRILIDACIPYEMKLKNTFPTPVQVSKEFEAHLKSKFSNLF